LRTGRPRSGADGAIHCGLSEGRISTVSRHFRSVRSRCCGLARLLTDIEARHGADGDQPFRIAVRFHHEPVGLEQNSDGVVAHIRNHADGAEYTVRARYLLGCDGGRTIPRMVGIPYEGLGVLAQTATAHVSADLSKVARDPDVLIRWIWCPAIGEMAVLVPMGSHHWGPDSEEWVCHVTYQGEGPKDLTDEQVERNMRLALGIPDLPLTIHKITRWTIEGVLASKLGRKGQLCENVR
jgi:2-polyprenyl-6-methoxyphenol hydroxylase-like FAD-dependent oxidoreductase